MRVDDLLDMPFMAGAEVLGGAKGLSREVTWCVPLSELSFGNWVMPGLVLLHAEEGPSWRRP